MSLPRLLAILLAAPFAWAICFMLGAVNGVAAPWAVPGGAWALLLLLGFLHVLLPSLAAPSAHRRSVARVMFLPGCLIAVAAAGLTRDALFLLPVGTGLAALGLVFRLRGRKPHVGVEATPGAKLEMFRPYSRFAPGYGSNGRLADARGIAVLLRSRLKPAIVAMVAVTLVFNIALERRRWLSDHSCVTAAFLHYEGQGPLCLVQLPDGQVQNIHDGCGRAWIDVHQQYRPVTVLVQPGRLSGEQVYSIVDRQQCPG